MDIKEILSNNPDTQRIFAANYYVECLRRIIVDIDENWTVKELAAYLRQVKDLLQKLFYTSQTFVAAGKSEEFLSKIEELRTELMTIERIVNQLQISIEPSIDDSLVRRFLTKLKFLNVTNTCRAILAYINGGTIVYMDETEDGRMFTSTHQYEGLLNILETNPESQD